MKFISRKKYPDGSREIKLFNFTIYKYKKKFNKEINGINNIINMPANTNAGLYINGSNNKVTINPGISTEYFVDITINGNNNEIEVNNIIKGVLHITIGNGAELPADNCHFHTGKNLSITEAAGIILYEHNSSFTCGDDVMISHGVTFRGSDGHAILSSDGEVLNRAHSIKIGNHVWICQDVMISKNTQIPDGCVAGAGAVVTKKFTQPNCVIAGVPARVVKENINWVHTSPDRLDDIN